MIRRLFITILILFSFFVYWGLVEATTQSTMISVEGIKLPKDTYTKLSKSPNKNFILLEILQAKQKIGTGEVQKQMDSMKKKVQELTKWAKTNDQKLSKIYERIVTNITYDHNRKNDRSKLYENNVGILTYRNKKWICGGISNVFWLMAFYAWETDIKHEEGRAIDREAHAWIKIANFYYDPTFDIWIRSYGTTKPWQHYYFKLPKNIINLDRNTIGQASTSKEEKLKQAKELQKKYKNKYPVIWYVLDNL